MTETRYKCGDVREDGLVFWQYDSRYRGGEYWITKEKYSEYTSNRNANQKKRYATDAGYRESRQSSKKAKYYGDSEHREAVLLASRERMKNPLLKARRRAYLKYRRENEPLYALSIRLRNRTLNAITRGGYSKSSSTAALTGCSWEELKAHIENQFVVGMSWGNFGNWHIDHVTPLASASNEEELTKLFHYTNLQPLWAKDNLSKGAKIFTNTL